MADPQMVMYEEEFNQIQAIVDKLVREANSRTVFIVDKNGQLIAAGGDIDHVDTTSLASLTAGNVAATGGIAKLLKENEFATQFHEGEKANIHIQLVGNRVILVVIFDSRSSLGLVRLRVKKASEELNHIFEALLKKVQEPGADSPFAEITDEDIDNLFNDCRGTARTSDVFHQLHGPGDQLQVGLLRSWTLREDHEPAVHLRAHQP